MASKYIIRLIWDNKRSLIAIAIVTFLIGEIWFRVPFILQRLEYHPDRLLGAKLRPDQKGFVWLGEMSLKSPRISINSDGYRGKEIDWSKKAILALGASESFGSSVSDHDVWSNKLEIGLRQSDELDDFVVINAGHPGFGPSHQIVRLKRFLGKETPEMIIVRVGIAGRGFHAPENKMQRAKDFRKAQSREKIRMVTKFFPFLYNKMDIQIRHMKQAVKPFVMRIKKEERREAKTSVADKFWESNKQYWYEIMRLADAKNIALIFCINDLTGLKSNRLISEYLRKASLEFSGVYVQYLGPETIGIENIEYKFAKRIFRDKFTMRLDLHGNALQHQILANNYLEFIKTNYLLNRSMVLDTKPVPLKTSEGKL